MGVQEGLFDIARLSKLKSSIYAINGLAFIILAAFFSLVYNASLFSDRLEATQEASSDSLIWLVSQLEADNHAFSAAFEKALAEYRSSNTATRDKEASDLRLKFDIFYSRVGVVQVALQRGANDAELLVLLDQQQFLCNVLSEKVETIDFSNSVYVTAFRSDIFRTIQLSRNIATMSLRGFVEKSGLARQKEQHLMFWFLFITFAVLCLIVIMSVAAIYLSTELGKQALGLQRAVKHEALVFNMSPNATFVTDAVGKIQLVNPMARSLFQKSGAQLLGAFIEELFVGAEDQIFDRQKSRQRSKYQQATKFKRFKSEMVRFDKTVFCADVTALPSKDSYGELIWVLIINDVSKEIEAEAELRRAKDDALANAKMKGLFLANASHEIRTPLHGLIAALDLIDGHDLPSTVRNLLAIARSCSERAAEQVNGVLEVTRAGEVARQNEIFKPECIVDGVLDELAPLAATKGNILIKGKGLGPSDTSYLGQSRLFSRVIYNLVSNAIKFTDKGVVTVTLNVVPSVANEVKLQVKVRDTGIGIKEKHRGRIFEAFKSGQIETATGELAVGLGLSIVREAVAVMGGQLELHSIPGNGSTFSIEIPLKIVYVPELQCDDEDKVQCSVSVKPLDVLVVDDKDINLTLLSMMVSQLGHRPCKASDGDQAVCLASDRKYDIILMDDSMPNMNGREATRRIRNGGLSKDALIVGVTAYVDQSRIAEFEEAGANSVLTKPLKKAQLALALTRLGESGEVLLAESLIMDIEQISQISEAYKQLCRSVDEVDAVRLLAEALADVSCYAKYIFSDEVSLESIGDLLHGVIGTTAFVGLRNLSRMLRSVEVAVRAGDRSLAKSKYLEVSRLAECEGSKIDKVFERHVET